MGSRSVAASDAPLSGPALDGGLRILISGGHGEARMGNTTAAALPAQSVPRSSAPAAPPRAQLPRLLLFVADAGLLLWPVAYVWQHGASLSFAEMSFCVLSLIAGACCGVAAALAG